MFTISSKVYIIAAIITGVVTAVAHAAVTNLKMLSPDVNLGGRHATSNVIRSISASIVRPAANANNNESHYFFNERPNTIPVELLPLNLGSIAFPKIPPPTQSVNYPTYEHNSFNEMVRYVLGDKGAGRPAGDPFEAFVFFNGGVDFSPANLTFSEVVGRARSRAQPGLPNLTQPAPISEPGAWAMFAVGVATLMALAKRRCLG